MFDNFNLLLLKFEMYFMVHIFFVQLSKVISNHQLWKKRKKLHGNIKNETNIFLSEISEHN